MASENLDVGTTANDGTGDALRDAFIKIRKMFAELYGQTYSSDTQDLSGATIDIDHDQLANRYTRVQTITSTTSPIDLECDDYAAFNLNGNLGTVTLNLNDLKTGQVVDILLSGSDLSSAVITLADSFSTSVISKVGSASLDTSATNLIQVVCVDDTDGAAIVNYSIATYTTNPTP